MRLELRWRVRSASAACLAVGVLSLAAPAQAAKHCIAYRGTVLGVRTSHVFKVTGAVVLYHTERSLYAGGELIGTVEGDWACSRKTNRFVEFAAEGAGATGAT